MNAISLLKNDHKTVEDLFKRFEKLGPRAVKSKQDLAERIVRELSIHAAIEEMAFYPAIREAAEKGDDGTNDLLISDVMRRNELQVWFLAEHVVDVPTVRA